MCTIKESLIPCAEFSMPCKGDDVAWCVVRRFGIKGHLDMVGVTVESPYSHNHSLYKSILLMQQHPEFYLIFFFFITLTTS